MKITNRHLAQHRTQLAKERTLLSYIRTALTLFVAGVSFVKFFQQPSYIIIGLFFAVAGIILFLIGVIRYRKVSRHVVDVK
ncbi:MAG TPA: DUF202 domain-containing protein [Patescibacteria group bacterium]|nr:DUF202 domain-containing protein [Patescibacteria group bacterium]